MLSICQGDREQAAACGKGATPDPRRCWIMNNLFWLADEQWQTIKPFLPIRHTGPRRVDDRRVISGIVHVLRSGCRWRDCPREYGPHTTIYNRFNRWSSREL